MVDDDSRATDGDGRRRLLVVAPGAQLTQPPTGNVLAQAWLVLVLAAGFGAMLAGLQYALGPRIAENKLDETLRQIPALVPGAAGGRVDDQTVPGRQVFRALSSEGKLVGWVVPGRGQGFADQIELLIGLDAPGRQLTGVFVLDQKETPGLGDNITSSEFLERFRGFDSSLELHAAQAPTDRKRGVVRALTGATISSAAVCNVINQTVALVERRLAAAERGASAGAE